MGAAEPTLFDTVSETIRTNQYQSPVGLPVSTTRFRLQRRKCQAV